MGRTPFLNQFNSYSTWKKPEINSLYDSNGNTGAGDEDDDDDDDDDNDDDGDEDDEDEEEEEEERDRNHEVTQDYHVYVYWCTWWSSQCGYSY